LKKKRRKTWAVTFQHPENNKVKKPGKSVTLRERQGGMGHYY